MQRSPLGPLLVVDDHHDSAVLTARVLSRAGYDVYTAETCADALNLARSEKFDVLISDVGLPDGDGCNLLANILEMYPVRAVAFTGHVMNGAKDRYQKAGFDTLLMKPTGLNEITSTVAALVYR